MSRSSASRSSSSPAGMPSTIATSPGPCDSPAVVKRNVVIAPRLSTERLLSFGRYRAHNSASARRPPHHLEVGFAAGPDFQRAGALLDEDLEAVDRRRPRRPGRLQQWAWALAVDHVDDGLARSEEVGLQGQVLERVLALQPRGAGVDDQLVGVL